LGLRRCHRQRRYRGRSCPGRCREEPRGRGGDERTRTGRCGQDPARQQLRDARHGIGRRQDSRASDDRAGGHRGCRCLVLPRPRRRPGRGAADEPTGQYQRRRGGQLALRGRPISDELGQADVVKILRGSNSVMLATALADGKILAHPMTAQEVTEDADVWFFLALDGDQAEALRTNPQVNISVAEAGNWLSVAGRVEFVDDPATIDELWSESANAWFDGREDPNLGLIKVVTDSAQHWGLPG